MKNALLPAQDQVVADADVDADVARDIPKSSRGVEVEGRIGSACGWLAWMDGWEGARACDRRAIRKMDGGEGGE